MQTVQKIYNTDLPHRAVSVYVYLCGRAGAEPALVIIALFASLKRQQEISADLCRRHWEANRLRGLRAGLCVIWRRLA